jgi:hypothetical protein
MPLTKLNAAGVNSLPIGSVLQTIPAFTTTEVPATSTTFVDTGLTAEITPISTSSKILITFSVFQFMSAAVGYGDLKLVRGSTDLETYGFNNYAGSSTIMSTSTYQYLDSPATTSAITYKIQFNCKNVGTVFCQYDDANGEGVSTMTLMEIKG